MKKYTIEDIKNIAECYYYLKSNNIFMALTEENVDDTLKMKDAAKEMTREAMFKTKK